MAGTTSQLTISKAIEIARQNQHGDIDPAVTTFLEQTIDAIWQRVKAQPSAYLFTKEEFAVFTYYRGRFYGIAIAQQAVRRFWEHRDSSQPASAKGVAVYLPSFTGDSVVLQEDLMREHDGQNCLAKPMSRALEKTVPKRSSFVCQRCHTRRVRCDKKKPFCSPCGRAGRETECTYDMQIKDKCLTGPNDDADENNTSHLKTRRSTFPSNSKVNADQINEDEDEKQIVEDFKVKMLPINKLKRRIQNMDLWDIIEMVDTPRKHVMNERRTISSTQESCTSSI